MKLTWLIILGVCFLVGSSIASAQFPTPHLQEPCYYRIPDSPDSRYRRLGYLDVTPLCWPIAVALASSLDYGLNHCVNLNIGVFFCR